MNGSDGVSLNSCKVPGCDRPLSADGYCGPHYKRKWRYGDPLAGGTFKGEPITLRLARLFTVMPSGCWEWINGFDNMGYGSIVVRRQTRRAHRVTYEAFRAPIPDGLDLDHLCHNKRCVNPDHLEPVTHSENLRRHYAPLVTACPHGHAYDAANTYMDHGKRRCRTCMRAQQRRRRAAR